MGSVAVRTAAGDVLSIPTTPADVVDHCVTCRRMYREGDWYCSHLMAAGRSIARLDAGGPPGPVAVEPAVATVLMPVFRAPGV